MESAEWDERYAGPDLVWGAGPNRFVVEQIEGRPAGRAIDLATGEGRNAIWLAGQGWQVTGVDFSSAGLARAAKLATDRGVQAEWVAADLREYQPQRDGFDLVLMAYLQLPEPVLAPVLARAAAAVAPGGSLLFIGHDADNLTRGVGGPQDPRMLHSAEQVTAALGGLDIVTAGQRSRPVPGPDGERSAIDTLVLAVRQA